MKSILITFTKVIGRTSTKGLGLVAQLLAMVFVAQLLGAEQFGIYGIVFSSASIAAQIVDFGLSRYLFRLAHRGKSMESMVRWSVSFRLLITISLIVPVGIYAVTAHLPLFAFMLALGAGVVYQLTNLNRYIVLLQDRIALAILIEIAPAFLYFVILAVVLLTGTKFGIEMVMGAYLVATVFAFVASVWLANSLTGWVKGIKSLVRQRGKWIFRGIRILATRSSTVGIEIVLSVTLINLPIIISHYVGNAETVGELAVFQRLLNLTVALLSVGIASNLKRYYNEGAKNIFSLSPAVISGAATGLSMWLALETIPIIGALYPALDKVTVFSLLLALGSHKLVAVLAVTMLATYVHISFAALGGGRLIQRCLATGTGVLVLLVMSVLLNATGLSTFEAVFGAFALGEAAAILFLVASIQRSGACLKLFGIVFSSKGCRARNSKK